MIKYVSFIFAMLFSLIVLAQKNNSSPYSFFGIGDNNPQATVSSASMGGINIANIYKSELNFSNPAAVSALRFTSFNMSGKSKFLWVDDGNSEQNTSASGLSSIALGVPIGEKGGLLAGLQPATNVGYMILQEFKDEEGQLTESNAFKGSGGTNRFFGSFGYEVTKDLRLGIEAEYLFGSINNDIFNQRNGVFLATRHRLISTLTGSSVKLGVQYTKNLKNELQAHIGATYKLKNSIRANSDEYLYSYTFSNTSERPIDTLMQKHNLKGEINRPGIFGTGIGLGKNNKWYAAIEYETQAGMDFSESIFNNNSKIQYSNKSRVSIGGFWIPKINSITSYWDRVVYRAGMRYENLGLSIKGFDTATEFTPVNDFGMSFGLGLPIGNQLSQVNLGFEYGKRGNTNNGLIKENYFNLRLSLNLADKWFHKRKID